jgi:lysyl-tRNA synthetase class I
MRKVLVPIQASKKHCEWCHFRERRLKLNFRPDWGKRWWCHLYARELDTDKRGALRCEGCIEGEVYDDRAGVVQAGPQ